MASGSARRPLAFARQGRNARTLVKYDDFRVVLMVLRASARIPDHKTNGRISVHVLSGNIRLNAAGRTFDMLPGSLIALDKNAPHDLEALQESALLLTIVWTVDEVGCQRRRTDQAA